MKPVLFLFYLQMIYTSHTFLKLLTHTPHRHHWYFPSSVVTELHLLPHASPSSTHSSMSAVDPPTVRAYSSSPRTNEKEMQLHPTHQRERDATPPHTQTSVQGPPSRLQSPSHLKHLWSVTPMLLAKHFSQTHPL